MFALFLAVTLALALLAATEFFSSPRRTAAPAFSQVMPRAFGLQLPSLWSRAAAPRASEIITQSPEIILGKEPGEPLDAQDIADAEIIARVKAALAEPDPERDAVAAEGTLPRVRGFRPGDRIALVLDGPVPHREEIRFVPARSGPHALAMIDDTPTLLIEGADPARLRFGVLTHR